jgi:hypothetical protein
LRIDNYRREGGQIGHVGNDEPASSKIEEALEILTNFGNR